jgi:hypothetical protein
MVFQKKSKKQVLTVSYFPCSHIYQGGQSRQPCVELTILSADVASMPFRLFVDHIDENLLITAGTLKANYPISYADSFATALAKIHECFLLSGDPEFKVLEKEEIIQVEWLR